MQFTEIIILIKCVQNREHHKNSFNGEHKTIFSFLVGNILALSTILVKGTGIPRLFVLCQNNACAAHTYFSTSKNSLFLPIKHGYYFWTCFSLGRTGVLRANGDQSSSPLHVERVMGMQPCRVRAVSQPCLPTAHSPGSSQQAPLFM